MTRTPRPAPNPSSPSATGDLARWIASVLDDAAPPGERAATKAALEGSERGRRLLAALATLAQPPDDESRDHDPARVARIMEAISALPAGDLPRIAEVVLDAWGDPAFREALRRDPQGAMRARGVAIPEALRVRIVGLDQGRFPSADRLDLPLPKTGMPAVGRADARQALADTDFGQLFGQAAKAGPREASPSGTNRRTAWLRALPRRAVAISALAAAVTLALWTARAMPDAPGDLSGTAAGMPAAMAVTIALAVVAVALALWWRRR